MMDRIPHREFCSLCHKVNRVGFWVPDGIWKAVVHRTMINSIICLNCFTAFADEKLIDWSKDIKLYPVSLRANAEDVGVIKC